MDIQYFVPMVLNSLIEGAPKVFVFVSRKLWPEKQGEVMERARVDFPGYRILVRLHK